MPDFAISGSTYRSGSAGIAYIEVKPESQMLDPEQPKETGTPYGRAAPDELTAPLREPRPGRQYLLPRHRYMRRMEVVWDPEPWASLFLVLGDDPTVAYFGRNHVPFDAGATTTTRGEPLLVLG